MKTRTHLLAAIITLALLCPSLSAGAKIKLPAFFADNMLMQQQTNANIWGTATPKKKVTITPSWDGKAYTTTADKAGGWKLSIPTPEAGGPYTLTISDGEELTLNNILIGELWLCSGQSNMEMAMTGFVGQPVEGGSLDILKSHNPDIRLFTVKRNSSTVPVDDVTGQWAEADPKVVRNFSATAYYFGRLVQEILDVPVGLIVAAWGGSACEAWMNEEMLQAFPEATVKIPAADGEIPSKNRTPTVLFKGMLSPLIGLTMKGVIWYQGEDNWNRAGTYADMFTTMITGWRQLWGQGDFPFYYCQIAPYDYSIIVEKGQPIYNTAYLREQQAKAEHMVPNTGMAVLMDVGFKEGIHPYNKRTPGERLAMLALNKAYGIEGVCGDSPYYKSMEIKHDTVVVSFNRAPLWVNGYHSFESYQFKLAGEDQVFYPAKAWCQRGKVYVKSEQVPNPVAVRYAFENDAMGDLFGGDGLPISSFRSDDWPDPMPLQE